MRHKFLYTIRNWPVFLCLLPIFFVLHGFTGNYNFVPVKDALLLTTLYLIVAVLIAGLAWLLYRNFVKACLASFSIMAFHFFFGSIHDSLKKLFSTSFPSHYVFVLPAAGILLLLIFIVLKKRNKQLSTITLYLNSLLLILILIDVAILTGKIINHKPLSTILPIGFTSCDSCAKPDVYFILADEYAGNKELKDKFNFDDSIFLHQLNDRNFHVVKNSHSNYNYTPFSLASILNMDYLDLEGKDRTQSALTYCYDKIKDNKVLQFLESSGYQFYNYSVFDFEGQPARTRETFLAANTRLITAQTFLSRFDRDIRFNLVSRFKSKSNLKILTYANKNNNENIYSLTWDLASQKTTTPKFIYTHLMMPHYPYYFNKDGKEQDFEKLLEGNQINKQAYIEYLQYTNQKLLELIDHIRQLATTPPIIILMGDHGFRHFTEKIEPAYYFLNLTAVSLPSNNYTALKDSTSSVNLFRNIFNSAFNQHLPQLKDTTYYLSD